MQIKKENGKTTVTMSLGEALMMPYEDVTKWTQEQKKVYDKECREWVESKIIYRSLNG